MTNEQLRALCLAATPGPWTPAGPSFGETLPSYYNCVCVDGDTDNDEDICGDMEHADAEYIAAMDPTTTLRLLDKIERLQHNLMKDILTHTEVIKLLQDEIRPPYKKPQNCGTTFCSCIECVMTPHELEIDDLRKDIQVMQRTVDDARDAMRLALECLTFLWRGVPMNYYALEKPDAAIAALEGVLK